MDKQMFLEVSGESDLAHIKELNLMNMKISYLDTDLVNKCYNLEKLNVSRNQLKSLSGLCLPRLQVLNFEDNCITDVTFLSDVPSLEKLYFDGNPLNVADRYIAVDQLPYLHTLDGKSCADFQKEIKKFYGRLKDQVVIIYSSKYEAKIHRSKEYDEILHYRRQFTRELINKMATCSRLPPKFQRYKVQLFIDDMFSDAPTTPSKVYQRKKPRPTPLSPLDKKQHPMESPLSPCTQKIHEVRSPSLLRAEKKHLVESPLSPGDRKQYSVDSPSSPRIQKQDLLKLDLSASASMEKRLQSMSLTSPKYSEETTLRSVFSSPKDFSGKIPVKSTFKHSPISSDTTILSPQKQRKRKLIFDDVDAERQLLYEPQMFLRSHSPLNDRHDCKTQVWGAAFEPDCTDESRTTDLLATCGGNIVCFINCRTGHVLKRYKGESLTENLYALTWTILPIPGKASQKTSVLAVGGSEKKIYLIHPLQLKCYLIFKAHNQAINCLQFHHSEKSWLFSGSTDNSVCLWDIGMLPLPDDKTSYKKLMTFDVGSEVVQMIISKFYNCFFVACRTGLKVWSLHGKINSWKSTSNANLAIPDICKSEESEMVDGLTLISSHCLGMKVSQSGKIVLCNLSPIFPNGKLVKKEVIEVLPIAIFLWSDCNSCYNYIHSSEVEGVMACGDNSGRLWLYDVQSYVDNKRLKSLKSELTLPSVMLPMPSLKYESEDLSMRPKIIVNSVRFNWNGEYLVACTDSNLLCIWKRDTP